MILLIILCQVVNLNVAGQSKAMLNSTNSSVASASNSFVVNGNSIQNLILRSYNPQDIITISGFTNKTPISVTDTAYTFVIPSTVQNSVYAISAVDYNNQPTTSQILVRLFNTSNNFVKSLNLDSSQIIGWGLNEFQQTKSPYGLNDVVMLVAGGLHSLALKLDGTVVGWGNNDYGQTSIPNGLNNVVAVAAGLYHSMALKSDGTVVTWGANTISYVFPNYGQSLVPSGLNNVISIAAGGYHSLAIKNDGTVVAWGLNNSNQTNVPYGINNAVAIAAGILHSLILKSDGTVVGFGDNSLGQNSIPSGLHNVVSIAAGFYHSLVLGKDGTVLAWGYNYFGQTNIPNGLNDVVLISAGGFYNIALKSDSSIVSWGLNDYGQTTIPIYSFDNQIGVLKSHSITAGGYHSLAFAPIEISTSANNLGSISPNTYVKYGDTVTINFTPYPNYKIDSVFVNQVLITNYDLKPDGSGSYTFENVMSNHSIRVVFYAPPATFYSSNKLTYKIGDTVTVRGTFIKSLSLKSYLIQDNFNVSTFLPKTFNANTNDTNYSFIVPNTVKNNLYSIKAYNYIDVESDSLRLVRFLVSLTNFDSLGFWAWGDPTYNINKIPDGLDSAVAIAAGLNHVLAIKSDGTVVAWGDNIYGQTNIPLGLNNVVAISGGGNHSLALKSDGTVVAWGAGGDGQTNVSDLRNIVAIAGGGAFSLALTSGGTMVARGANGRGQTSIPSGLKQVVLITAGSNHAVALKSDGTIVAWGANDVNQTSVPDGLNNVVSLNAGWNHTLALKSDSTIVAWGAGTVNAGFDPNLGQSIVPKGLDSVVAIFGGELHSLALKSDSTLVAWGDNDYGQSNIPYGLSNILLVAVGGNHNLIYSKLQISTSQSGSGSISPSTFVKYGDSLQITFSPSLDYKIDSVFVNQLPITDFLNQNDAGGSYTFRNIQSFNNIRVVFKFAPSTIIATDQITYQKGDTIEIRGSTIQTFKIKNYVAKDSFIVSNFFNKTFNDATNDTTYYFVIPNTVKNGIYLIEAYSYTNQISDSIRLIRCLVTPSKIDSFGIFTWGDTLYKQATLPNNNTDSVVSVAAGENHSIALKANGTVLCWGNNIYGQTNVPQDLNNVVAISGGGNHSLALKSDGTVVAWGAGSNGQTNVDDLENIVSIAGGGAFSLALKADGTVIARGDNGNGQTNIPLGLKQVVSIAAGSNHAVALKSDGTLVAWGSNDFGQTSVPQNLTNVIAIASGWDHVLALKSDSTIAAWGAGTINTGFAPNLGQSIVPNNLNKIIAIAGGEYYTLALKSDSTLVAWGDNLYNQSTIPSNLANVVVVAAGGNHSLTLAKLKISTCTNGLGNISPSIFVRYGDSIRITYSPFAGYSVDSIFINDVYIGRDSLNGFTFKNIYTLNTIKVNFFKPKIINYSDSVVFRNFIKNKYVDYGLNYRVNFNFKRKYLFNGIEVNGINRGLDSTIGYTFYNVRGDSTIKILYILGSLSEIFNLNKLVYKPNDTIVISGRCIKGIQIKSGLDSFRYFNIIKKIPINNIDTNYIWVLPSNFKNKLYFLQGINYYNILSSDLRLFNVLSNEDSVGLVAWGENRYNQSSLPNKIDSVVSIAAGLNHSLALKSDGTVVGWGYNFYGQTDIPQGLDNVVSISGGGNHSLALKSDGTVVAWGAGGNGQTNVDDLENIVSIAGGGAFSLALKADSTVIARGDNGNGQTNIPLGLKQVVSIAAGSNHAVALKSDSTVVAWGSNDFGQTSVPIDLNKVIAIASGWNHSLALKSDSTIKAWGAGTTNNGNNLNFGQAIIPNGLNEVASIAGGEFHSVALKYNGSVFAWGDSNSNQTTIPNGLTNAVLIAVGGNHNLALAILKVTTRTNGLGSISPSSFVKNGDNYKVSYKPSMGYIVDSVYINGILNTDSLQEYTFNNIDTFNAINVVFSPGFNILTTVVNGTIAPQQRSKPNKTIRITYLPHVGYELDSIFINDNYYGKDSLSGYTFYNISGDSNIRVVFKIKQYFVFTEVNFGTINPAGLLLVDSNSSVKITWQANTGYELSGILINNLPLKINNQMPINEYVFKNISDDSSIFVFFKIKQFKMTSLAINGTISPSGTNIYNSFTNVRYTWQPQTGYELDSLIVNELPITNYEILTAGGGAYTFNNLLGDSSIRVVFKIKHYNIVSSVTNGLMSPLGTNTYDFNSNVRYTWQANIGYELDSLIVNNKIVAFNKQLPIYQYIFNNVSGDSSIRVVFKLKSYTIVSFAKNGTINPNGTNMYDTNSMVRYTWSTDSGYILDSVKIGNRSVDSLNGYTFVVNKNDSIKVIYKIKRFIINTNALNGSISANGTVVNYGDSFTVYFKPNSGYKLGNVLINGKLYVIRNQPNLNFYTFRNIRGDSSLNVYYSLINYPITTQIDNGGSITASTSVDSNSNKIVTYQAASGYKISGITINGISQNFDTNSLSGFYIFLNISKNQIISVSTKKIFIKQTQFLITTSFKNGVGSGITLVDSAGSIRITYSPSSSYSIDSIFINDIYLNKDSISGYTFYNVRGDSNIRIVFDAKIYDITSSAINGTITPTNTSYYPNNSKIRYTWQANNGYILEGVYVGGNRVDSAYGYTFTVNKNDSIRVVFTKKRYSIFASAMNGTITPTGTNFYDSNSLVVYTWQANRGYILDSVYVGRNKVYSTSGYTFRVIKNDSIKVYFSLKRYLITTQINNGGFITPYTLVDSNSNTTISYLAASGYKISSLSINGISQDIDTNSLSGSFILKNVSANINMSVMTKIIPPSSIKQFIITTSYRNGTGSGIILIDSNKSSRITYTANQGYILDSIIVNSNYVGIDSSSGYSFNNVRSNNSISVVYKIKPIRIFATAINGTITNNGAIVASGGNISVNFRGNSGYVLDSVIINGIWLNTNYDLLNNTYTFNNVLADSSIRVVYKLIFIPANTISIAITNPTCLGQTGSIKINNTNSNLNLNLVARLTNTVNNKSWNYMLPRDSVISGLSVDSLYELYVRDTLYQSITRTFQFTIKAPANINILSAINYENKTLNLNLSGGDKYYLYNNGQLIKTVTQNQFLNLRQQIPLQTGVNKIEIKSDLVCQTSYIQTILINDAILIYPNPAQNYTNIHISGGVKPVNLKIISDQGQVLYTGQPEMDAQNKIRINLEGLKDGIYLIQIQGEGINSMSKLIINR